MYDYGTPREFDSDTSAYAGSGIDNLLVKLGTAEMASTAITQDRWDLQGDQLIHIGDNLIGQRKVYLPAVADVEYLRDTYECPYIWLRSAFSFDGIMIYNAEQDRLEWCCYNDDCAVRPMFKINLDKIKNL